MSEPEITPKERMLIDLSRHEQKSLGESEALLAKIVESKAIELKDDGGVIVRDMAGVRRQAPAYGLAKWGKEDRTPSKDPAERIKQIDSDIESFKHVGRSNDPDDVRISRSQAMASLMAERLDIERGQQAEQRAKLAEEIAPAQKRLAELRDQKPVTDQERIERATEQAALIHQIEQARAKSEGRQWIGDLL